MPAFIVGKIKLTHTRWLRDYAKSVSSIIARHGGAYLVQTRQIETLEGEPERADIMIVIQFPDRESALAFYNDPDYELPKQARLQGSTSESVLVVGVPDGARG